MSAEQSMLGHPFELYICCVMSCRYVLVVDFICSGPSAMTLYMCLESLVDCMKQNLSSLTYFVMLCCVISCRYVLVVDLICSGP